IESAQRDLPADTPIVIEIPLLYEGGLQTWFDQVVVVTAPEAVQRERLQQRNGLDAQEADRRIAAQWPLERKVALADHVLVNDGSFSQLKAAVENLWPLLNRRRKND
ncbi:MAG: dephospho-CoA kinase, partial [Chthonomonadaceae bacterium]|nr:dephospho-CoA kinase [Chthonomonadaceae bacterium]